MKINNTTDAENFIAGLRDKSQKAQIIQLTKAIESLELDQMYYEQKGSERGQLRTESCLVILNAHYSALQKN